MRENEDSKGRGGGRLKLRDVDGDVPLSMRSFDEGIQRQQQQQQKTKRSGGSNDLNSRKEDSRSKTASGSKDLCGIKTTKKNKENGRTKEKDIIFIVLQKNMRSMHSSERIEEMICELEGYRWDASVLNETWRPAKSEIWETHHKHMFMGAGKYVNKHGVGIMLNKKWRQRIIDTEYISERAITATIMVNHQRIKLMSVYFPHSGFADHHVEKMYRTIEKHTSSSKKSVQIVGGDFNAELGPGSRNRMRKCWPAHTQWSKQKRRLAEALADDTEFHSTQHDI